MKILFVSLGCDKNLADSEEMLGLLTAGGHEITDDETQADAIVINTCCFIHDAKEESVNTILEMAEYKKSGTCKALLVSGCMAQRYKEEILQEVPEVDGILGTTSYDEVSKVLAEALKGERVSDFHDLSELPETKMRSKRLVTTGGHYAFLKISEGCNKRYYPVPAWTVPQCADGAASRRGKGACGSGCEGTDSCRTGDDALRRGFVWREDPAETFT